jgi:hypothetical protein
MPPLPTIADTYRVTLDWSVADGVNPANVMHFTMPSGSESDLFDALTANLNEPMFACVSSAFRINGVSILKLDGSSATQSFVLATPIDGTSGAEFSPASAGIVKLQTTQRGPRGRGRQYYGPVGEDAMSNGGLGSSTTSAMSSGWADFLPGIAADGAPLVVASYVHSDVHQVTAVTIEAILGTQRRRQNQLR